MKNKVIEQQKLIDEMKKKVQRQEVEFIIFKKANEENQQKILQLQGDLSEGNRKINHLEK
jgi:hypothetical protein